MSRLWRVILRKRSYSHPPSSVQSELEHVTWRVVSIKWRVYTSGLLVGNFSCWKNGLLCYHSLFSILIMSKCANHCSWKSPLRFAHSFYENAGGTTSRYGLTTWREQATRIAADSALSPAHQHQVSTPCRGMVLEGSPVGLLKDDRERKKLMRCATAVCIV